MPRPVVDLVQGFLDSTGRFPDRPALRLADQSYTYAELLARASGMVAALHDAVPKLEPPRVAILAERSLTAYQGILSALLSGYAYVPLSPQFPATRTGLMLQRSECRVLIADPSEENLLAEILESMDSPLTVLLPAGTDVSALASRFPQHEFITAEEDARPLPPARQVSENDLAYLMFTSGSTGIPKGVMVTHGNICHFLDYVVDRYRLTEEDRLSQMFDLVFDLSVFDLFAAWKVGACVCVPTRQQLLTPARFIQEAALTVWFSVPSVGSLMKRLRLLEPGSYPRLRLLLFCGEALTAEVAQAWSEAAPQAILENLYGPTELTLCCTFYRWEGDASMEASYRGVVPIGFPFPGGKVLIADELLREVPDGQPGELLMAGPQVAAGYLNDPEKTAAAFVVPPGTNETYYRTGDRVLRVYPVGPLHYLGRMDHQLKVRGNRIELGEIEAALRQVMRTEAVAAVGWPVTEAGADGIVAFVVASESDVNPLRRELARLLPAYAVPREIRFVADLPLNPNGKLDRSVLWQWCSRSIANV